MFRLFECLLTRSSCVQRYAKVPLANKVRGGSFSSRCDEGHQFMFRLFECLVNETSSSPETQVTNVSNTYHQLKKRWSVEGPVSHFEF